MNITFETNIEQKTGIEIKFESEVEKQTEADVTSIDISSPTMRPTSIVSETSTPFRIPTPTEIIDDFGADMVLVPAGEFIMGSNPDEPNFWGAESPRHVVYLDDFWIQRTEVTNNLYHRCVDAGACQPPKSIESITHDDYYTNSVFENYPVINVSYKNALTYCQWIGGRLPTEAEWEKAARGTEGYLYPWGNEEINANLANFCDIGCPQLDEAELNFDDGYRDTAPVGSYPAGSSPYGVLDMAGNVLEWVSDWYLPNYYEISPYKNPLGPSTGNRHPIRGGSWYSGRSGLRTTARASLSPDSTFDKVGFRCARETPDLLVHNEPSGKIVYTCQTDRNAGNDQICIMNPDGSNQRQLTHNSFENYYPSVAPDGKSVVFVSNQTGNFEIYEIDLNGNQQQLTSGIGELTAPEISPDGARIIFTNNSNQITRIWLMKRNGDNAREIYFKSGVDALDPTWAPDSDRVLFAVGPPSGRKLYTMSVNGSGLQIVNQSFVTRGRSDWSPDGKLITSYSGESGNRKLYIMNTDGSDLHLISSPNNNSLAPAFSPDGQWVTFMSYMDHPNDPDGCEIYIMRIDGTDVRRLTDNNYCDWQPRWGS